MPSLRSAKVSSVHLTGMTASLDSGEVSLNEICCKERVEYSKSQYIVAEAIGIFVGKDLKRRGTLRANAHAVLVSALGLDNSTHPLVAVFEVRNLYSSRCRIIFHIGTYIRV